MPAETAPNPTCDQAADAAMATLSQTAAVDAEPTGDTDKAPEPTQEQTPTETPVKETVESDELISAEEVATLDDAGKANYKKMQKAFTEKTQKLAAQRKEAEAYKPYQELIKAYQTDPTGTIQKLASQHGL